MTDLNDINIKNVDHDYLLDLYEEFGSAYVKVLIEVTQRSNDMKFTSGQVERMTNLVLKQTCNAYDSLNITKEQMDVGTESIKNIVYDSGR